MKIKKQSGFLCPALFQLAGWVIIESLRWLLSHLSLVWAS